MYPADMLANGVSCHPGFDVLMGIYSGVKGDHGVKPNDGDTGKCVWALAEKRVSDTSKANSTRI